MFISHDASCAQMSIVEEVDARSRCSRQDSTYPSKMHWALAPCADRGDGEGDVRHRLEGAVADELEVPGGGPVHRQPQQQRAGLVRALLDLQLL